MKKNFKKAMVFITCAMVGGAALFASPAKDKKEGATVQAEYFPLLGVTVIETKDGKGNVSVEFKEGNYEYLSTVTVGAKKDVKPGCIHGVNCKDKKCRKPDAVIPEHPVKPQPVPQGHKRPVQRPDVEHRRHDSRPQIQFPEHHKSEPQHKRPEHHRSEPQHKKPEHHRSEPQVRGPEHHKSEPQHGSSKGPVALKITAQNDR